MDWYCNKCGKKAEIFDADTLYLEFDGIQEAFICENCNEWWFSTETAKKIKKGESDCEAKMH